MRCPVCGEEFGADYYEKVHVPCPEKGRERPGHAVCSTCGSHNATCTCVRPYVARTRSERGQAIKRLEKKAFFQGAACPVCGRRLEVQRAGKKIFVPDARCVIDNGRCLECQAGGVR